MDPAALWVPVGSEGRQGGSSNVPRDPGDGKAVSAASRRAAALLLNKHGPLKESRNSDRDAHDSERCYSSAC